MGEIIIVWALVGIPTNPPLSFHPSEQECKKVLQEIVKHSNTGWRRASLSDYACIPGQYVLPPQMPTPRPSLTR